MIAERVVVGLRKRWFVFEKPALTLKSNFGDERGAQIRADALRLELLPDASTRRGPACPWSRACACAKPGILTGPISLSTSPLTKKRTCSDPPLAFMPYCRGGRVRIGVSSGSSSTLNDVRLSSVQVPRLSRDEHAARESSPPASWPHEAYVGRDTCCGRRPRRPHRTTSIAWRRRGPSCRDDDDAVRRIGAVQRRGRRTLHDLDVLDLVRIEVV